MKIGVKTFDSEKFLMNFQDKADFFEVMAINSKDYNFVKRLNKPVVIHAMHEMMGVNIADKSKKKFNSEAIGFAIKVADLAKAEKIIVHPGKIKNENCSVENAIDFLKEINEPRIIVENLYGEGNFSRPSEFRIFKKYVKGFCFDINHAINKALEEGIDPYFYIKEFIELGPAHYHLGGQSLSHKKEHICLKDSDIDLKKILKLLPEDAEVTLETEVDAKKVLEDINIAREHDTQDKR